jgi:ethanolamine utilization protein EutN
VVAVDTLGAGLDEVVLFCQGSSARQATGMKALPVDAVIVGIVDTVDVLNNKIYPPKK